MLYVVFFMVGSGLEVEIDAEDIGGQLPDTARFGVDTMQQQ